MVNWGFIGCGSVTEKKSGPAFSKIEGSKVVAVMRRNATKAKDYAARHGIGVWYTVASNLSKTQMLRQYMLLHLLLPMPSMQLPQ